VSVTITNYACDSQPKSKTNGESANYEGSIPLTVMQMWVLQ